MLRKLSLSEKSDYFCLDKDSYKVWFFDCVKENQIELLCSKIYKKTAKGKDRIDILYRFVDDIQKGLYGEENNFLMWAYILLQAIYNKIYNKKYAMLYFRKHFLKKYAKFKVKKEKRKTKILLEISKARKTKRIYYRGARGRFVSKERFKRELKKLLKNI